MTIITKGPVRKAKPGKYNIKIKRFISDTVDQNFAPKLVNQIKLEVALNNNNLLLSQLFSDCKMTINRLLLSGCKNNK